MLHPSGEVLVHCDPADALVAVDGLVVGQAQDFDGTQRFLKLSPGFHRVLLSRPGFESFSTEVTAEGRQTLSVNLSPVVN